MTILEILLLAASMAIDAFAVCLAAGALPVVQGPRPSFRLAFHFGFFQFLMPVLGWLAGTTIEPIIRDLDHWAAFALLAFVGGRMIYSSRQPGHRLTGDPSRGWTLVMLSTAVSIDALAVGLSLGLVGIGVGYPALLIGVTTSALSLLGLRLGSLMGGASSKTVELLGGLVLIGIGIRIVAQHLML